MDPCKSAEAFFALQRELWSTTARTNNLFCEQVLRFSNIFIEYNAFIPEEGKRGLKTWFESCLNFLKYRTDIKKMMDESCQDFRALLENKNSTWNNPGLVTDLNKLVLSVISCTENK